MNLPHLDKPSIRVGVPTLGAIAAGIGILTFIGGWFSSHAEFRSEMVLNARVVADLQTANTQIQNRLYVLSRELSEDRQSLTNRLGILETDVKYVRQDVAEIKLAIVPKR